MDRAPSGGASRERFQPAAVPGIVAELGAAWAVSMPMKSVDAHTPGDECSVTVPDSLASAVPARVRAFLAGRHCAARCLSMLAAAPTPDASVPLPTGAFGAPVWPSGIIGSITHSAQLAMAVATCAGEGRGIGIDCEGIMSAVAAEEIAARVIPEAGRVARRDDGALRMPWPVFVTAVFSAKESIYKCLNPLVGVFFEFDAVALQWIDVRAGTMGFEVRRDLGSLARPGTLLTARFCVDDVHVVTAVAHSAPAAILNPNASSSSARA